MRAARGAKCEVRSAKRVRLVRPRTSHLALRTARSTHRTRPKGVYDMPALDLDKGFFDDARKHGVHPLTHLTNLKRLEQPEIDRVYQRTLRAFHQKDDGSCRAHALYQYAYDIAGLEKQLEELDIRT